MIVSAAWSGAISSSGPPPGPPPGLLDGAILLLRNNVVTSGGVITQWTDESGNGHHATPVPGKPAPTLKDNIYGNNAAVFTGAESLYIPSLTLPAGTKDITVFLTGQSSTSGYFVELSISSPLRTDAFCVSQTVGRLKGDVGDNYHYFTKPNDTLLTRRVELFKSKPSEEVTVYSNGVVSSRTRNDNGNNTNDFSSGLPLYLGGRAGANSFIVGEMASVMIFPFKVTGARADAIEAYYHKQNNPIT